MFNKDLNTPLTTIQTKNTKILNNKLVILAFKTFAQNLPFKKWVKVFKNGPSKICGTQHLKNLKWSFANFTWPILELLPPTYFQIMENLKKLGMIRKIRRLSPKQYLNKSLPAPLYILHTLDNINPLNSVFQWLNGGQEERAPSS